MPAIPLPIAALAAASHLAPALVAPFFRRLMLNPRRHVRPPPILALPPADERMDLGDGLVAWIGLMVVLQNVFSSLFNSHLFDFTHGWVYVVGFGIAGGAVLKQTATFKR